MAQIALEDVTKDYGADRALDGVSITFPDEITTAVVGTSGSGKSTLLQLINGLVRPSAGRVYVFEKSIDYGQLPQLRLQIGYAVQGTGLFPHLSVLGNMTLLGRLGGWSSDRVRERAAQLMKLVGLPESFGSRYPHELSGGQQQRVGLCRAMFLNPRIFLLDEPFGALDPVTRGDIHTEFLHLQRSEPRTMVLVTHDLREARKLARHLVVLERGRIVQQGSFDEILHAPAEPFVSAFFHSQLDD